MNAKSQGENSAPVRLGSDQSSALVMNSVSFAYPSLAGQVPVLHEVSMALASDEWVAVMGPSGSGKSTALLCAAGLLRPQTGEVLLQGIDIGRAAEKQLTVLRRYRIGFVFQELNLVHALTVEQNVGLPARFGRTRLAPGAVMETLARVGLRDKARFRPDQLSGGERQRVAIARALVSRPDVMFADEPTGALDIRSGNRVLDELQELKANGTAILMVTHDPRVAARADRVIWLRDGRIFGEMSGATAERIATRLARLEDDV